jgi:hypothetical protein
MDQAEAAAERRGFRARLKRPRCHPPKIISAQSGPRQHLGVAPMHHGQVVSQFDPFFGQSNVSNVSYNVKKMVETEYLAHERSVHDRRSRRLLGRGRLPRDARHRLFAGSAAPALAARTTL